MCLKWCFGLLCVFVVGSPLRVERGAVDAFVKCVVGSSAGGSVRRRFGVGGKEVWLGRKTAPRGLSPQAQRSAPAWFRWFVVSSRM